MTERARFAIGTGEHLPLPSRNGGDTEIAQIAHDLKNPLSSIALEAQLLDARLADGERFDPGRAIDRIARNVMYLERLICDLLDACTFSEGRFTLRLRPCELRDLLSAVIDRVVPAADRYRVFFDAHDAIEVDVDDLRIERVVANLLDNALKYTPSNGAIVVRLTKDADADLAEISVCDAGAGLTPDEIGFVFEPHRRGASSAGRPGTGLGLFVSKQIVEAHGGAIGVESLRGAGATFFFTLPLRH